MIATTQLSTLTVQQHTATRTAVAASRSPLATPPRDPRVHRQCTIPAGKWCKFIQAEEKAVQTARKLIQEDFQEYCLEKELSMSNTRSKGEEKRKVTFRMGENET